MTQCHATGIYSTYSIFIQSCSCSDTTNNHSGSVQHIFSLFPTYFSLKQQFIVLHRIQRCIAGSNYFTLEIAAQKSWYKSPSIIHAVLHKRSICSGSVRERNLIFLCVFPCASALFDGEATQQPMSSLYFSLYSCLFAENWNCSVRGWGERYRGRGG